MIQIDTRYRLCFDSAMLSSSDWKFFVEQNPDSNIFHTYEFYKSFADYPNYKPTPIFILDDRDVICGIIMLIVYSEKNNVIGKLTTRAISLDFPLVPEAIDFGEVVSIIKSKFSKKLVHWNVVPFKESTLKKRRLLDAGFVYEPHLNFVFNLTIGESLLFSQIGKTRRKQIRRAEKRGVRIRTHDSVTDFSEHYTILSQTYKDAGLPLFDIDYFKSLINGLKQQQILIAEATVEGKLIGFRLVLLHKKYMYDFYAGANKEYYSFYPNDILVWETLKYGAKNGFSVFNFGGAGHPDKEYGVREFKKSFGGELINSGVFRTPINGLIYNAVKLVKMLRSS